jgi:hypothetical protein
VTGNNDAFIFENEHNVTDLRLERELLFKMCHGRDIAKWYVHNTERRMLYTNAGTEIEKYPNANKWLERFKDILMERRECKNGVIPWYSLQWPREKEGFKRHPKILIQNTRNERLQPRIVACMDELGLCGTQGLNFIEPKGEADPYILLGILNSRLINYVFSTKLLNLAIKAEYLKKLRLPRDYKSSDLGVISMEISEKSMSLYELGSSFIRFASRKLEFDTVSKKMEDWYLFPYSVFVKELKKLKISMSYAQDTEIEGIFSTEAEKCIELKLRIEQLEFQLNEKVYSYYGLTKSEIDIVEEFSN